MFHRLLARQLRKLGLDETIPPNAKAWQRFLERVNQAYIESDQDRNLLERSLTISSGEMKALNESLQKSSEGRLAEERDKLQAVISSLGEGLCVLDQNGSLRFINPEGERLLGWQEGEFMGQAVLGLVGVWNKSKQPGTVNGSSLQELIGSGRAYRNEDSYLLRKDGTAFPASYVLNPMSRDGVLLGAVFVFRDITERKQIEEKLAKRAVELEEATSFLDSVIENLPTMLFVKDAEELRFVHWNKAGEELTGFTREEFIGKNDYDFFPKEEADFFTTKDREVLNEGKLLDIPEEPIQTKHQGTRLLHTRKIPIYGLDGKPKYLLGISEDITEPKQAEEELRKLSRAVEQSPNTVIITNLQGYIEYANPRFTETTGYTLEEVMGQHTRILKSGETSPEEYKRLWETIAAGNEWRGEFHNRKKNGELYWESASISPIKNTEGVITHFLAVKEEITEKKRAEETLAKRAIELQTVVQVGTAVATNLEVDRLLQEVVDLTKTSFNLYHAHIYLLNETGDTLVLTAGAGEVGRQMVNQGWSISLGRERSLVARAARTRQGVVVNDVRQEPDFLPNPLLPETRAEMAIPLVVSEQVLGVLDVQAAVVDRFSEEDVYLKTILTGQVAVALQNARLFAQQQQARFLLNERVKELNCLNDIGREIAETPPVPELLQWVTERIPPAMRYSELCVAAIEYDSHIYGVPKAVDYPCQIVHALRVGGEVMGRIYISYAEKREFLDEESALIGGIASRLSSYIESRRLLEQVQETLAIQEHLTVELDSQRRTLQAVLDNMPAGVFVAEAPSGKPLLVNEQLKQLLGRRIGLDIKKKETAEIHALYRQGTDALYPPDQTPLARGLLGESITIDDMEVRHPNGSRTLLQVVGAPIRDAQGSISASVAIFQDITERKQVEEILRENEARLSEALTVARLGNWELDLASQIFTLTDQFYVIYHTTAEREDGYQMPAMQFVQKFVHPDDAYRVGTEIRQAIESTGPIEAKPLEHRILRADGSEGYVLVRFRVVTDEHGRAVKTVGANQDITEQKLAEVERERLLAEIEAAYRQYVRGEWRAFLHEQHRGRWHIEHRLSDRPVEQAPEMLGELQDEVIREGKIKVVMGADNDHEVEPTLVAPIALRGQIIGTLSLQDIAQEREWTSEEMALVETVSEQLALTLENLRLFDNTQKQATREQLARQIADKMRAAPDVESIIQTGLTELGKALGVSRSYVKLTPKE